MSQTVLEKAREEIADRTSKATAKVSDAVRERLDDARLAMKRGAHAADEFMDDSRIRIKRHPRTAVAGGFAVGMGLGLLFGLFIRRR